MGTLLKTVFFPRSYGENHASFAFSGRPRRAGSGPPQHGCQSLTKVRNSNGPLLSANHPLAYVLAQEELAPEGSPPLGVRTEF